MRRDDVVNLHGTDFLPAFIDEFLDPAGEIQVAVSVSFAIVARAEEAVRRECGGVGFWIREIAGRDARTADADFAFGSRGGLFASHA